MASDLEELLPGFSPPLLRISLFFWPIPKAAGHALPFMCRAHVPEPAP